MKGTGAGWDSILYRIYIIGGIAGIVIVTVVTSVFLDPQGKTMLPIYAGGGCVTLFLLGILGNWWIQILFGGYGDVTRMSGLDETEIGPPEISSLKSWSTLFEAMVIYGGDIEALDLSRRKSGRPLVEWFAWANVLALFPLINMWLYLFGVMSQETFLTYIRPAIVIIAVLMLVRTYFLLKGNARNDEETIFAPLGLSLVEVSEAGSILEGQRHGHNVHILVDGSQCTIHLSGTMPHFEVASNDGKFQLSNSLPSDIHASLKSLRKAKRWKGVKLKGNADGITIERDSRGLNMWLYDLWLAERVTSHNFENG